MCGIFGVYNLKSPIVLSEDKIRRSICSMKHRGPDATGIKVFEAHAALAHLRLSIIDLNEESNQPFQIDNRYWITFNGEIYNYIEIREELRSLGHCFRTGSDTEVLVRSYESWGEDCVKRFNGMWAFAIYDSVKNKLFCSRDRFGVKPFNYTEVEGQFIFSSEIKAIINYLPGLKKPNYNVIANFCRTSVGAQIKETWFENIFRLEPAHNLTIQNNEIKIHRYWDYPTEVNESLSFEDAVDEYKRLLLESVKLRMRSDVPVGFTLSSGIDSTSLVSLLKCNFGNNTNTYTAAFTETEFAKKENRNFRSHVKINEVDLVKRLTADLQLNPSIIEIDFSNYVNDLTKIIFHLESGHGSPAVFPLYKILEEATKDVTVILEGQGADELLAGYINNVYPIYIAELLKRLRIRKAFKEIFKFSKNYSWKTTLLLAIRNSNMSLAKKVYYKASGMADLYIGPIRRYREMKDYPNEGPKFSSALNSHLYKAHTGGLVNLLHYGDAISMAHSLESRLPFMDYKLVEFAFTLPFEHKVNNGVGKYIHRKAMKGIVPDYIINNPIKFGFDSPLSHLFNQEGDGSAKSILLSVKCLSRGLFSEKGLRKAFQYHKNGRQNYSRVLYRMLSVELWFREFIDA